jgi:predicted transcriptional regulator
MRFGMVALAAFGLVLFMALPASAAPGTVTGTSALPITLSGQHGASAADAQFLLAGDAGQVSILLQDGTGQATRVVQRAYDIISTTNPSSQVRWAQKVETVNLDLKGAFLTLNTRMSDFHVLAYDAAARLDGGSSSVPLQLTLLPHDKDVAEHLHPPISIELVSASQPFDRTIPAGLLESSTQDGRLVIDGAFTLFISEADLSYMPATGATQDVPAHYRIETRPGTVYNPLDGTWMGVGTHNEYVQEYLLVSATSGHMEIRFAGVAGSLFSAHPTLQAGGDGGVATLPRMTGRVTVTDNEGKATSYDIKGQDLTLGGRFSLDVAQPATGSDSVPVRGDGDITTVTYGAVADHYDWSATITAVGLGALVIAGLAWIGKAVIGPLGGTGLLAGYARVHGDEVLEHPGRAEVYERVKAGPGVSFIQLANQVTFGASTLNYHLRVLERNSYITSVRDGRYLRFFDRRSGLYSAERKFAVSALRNSTTAAIAQHIRDHPGVAQCELAEQFGITPSTVTWHINRLAGRGLVAKARDSARARYYLGDAWASLPAEERDRQMAAVAAV